MEKERKRGCATIVYTSTIFFEEKSQREIPYNISSSSKEIQISSR